MSNSSSKSQRGYFSFEDVSFHQTETKLLASFTLGFVSALLGASVYRRHFKRIQNGDWIMPDAFTKKRWIRGVVTSVGDSDNFRLYHTPAFGWSWPLKFKTVPRTTKELKDQTLHIRIAGVDAPEAAHFGRPAQPYSAEALQWLQDRISGKTVYCQLLRRDQYSRVVSVVKVPSRFNILPGNRGKNLSIEMLRSGWVTIYEQSNAEYGSEGKETFLAVEAEAKNARRGIWKDNKKLETPAEYKRRYAQSASQAEMASQASRKPNTGDARQESGWLSRLLGR